MCVTTRCHKKIFSTHTQPCLLPPSAAVTRMTETFAAPVASPSAAFLLPPPYAEHMPSPTPGADQEGGATSLASSATASVADHTSQKGKRQGACLRRKCDANRQRERATHGDDSKNDMAGGGEPGVVAQSRSGPEGNVEVDNLRHEEAAGGAVEAPNITAADVDANVYRFRARQCMSWVWLRHMWRLTIERGERVETRLTGILDCVVAPTRRLWVFMMRLPQLRWLVRQFEAFLRWIFTGTDWSSHVAWILGGTVGYSRKLVKSVGAIYADLYRVRKTYFCVVMSVLVLFAFWNETLAHVQAPTSLLHDTVGLVSTVAAFRRGSLGLFLALGLPAYLPFVLAFMAVKNVALIFAWIGGWLFAAFQVFWEALRLMSKTFADEIIPGCVFTGTYVVLQIIVPLCKLALAIPFWGAATLLAVFTGLMAILVTGMSAIWMVLAVIGNGLYVAIEGAKTAPDVIASWVIRLLTRPPPPIDDPTSSTAQAPADGTFFLVLVCVAAVVLAALVFFLRGAQHKLHR